MRTVCVVPAYRAEWCLGLCLQALVDAGFPKGDIVVVNDGSPDRTREIALAAGVRLVDNLGNSGAAAARNLGAKVAIEAGADLLLFVDSDVVVHPDVRTKVQDLFDREPQIDAAFGGYDDTPRCSALSGVYRNLLHHLVHKTGPRAPTIFWTGIGAVRPQAFEAIEGFSPRLRMMEDVEFGYRLTQAGYSIRLDTSLKGTHQKCWTVRQMVRMDIRDRAIPWSRLMLFETGMAHDFNLSTENRVSALLVLLFVASIVLALVRPELLVVAAAALLSFVWLNRRLFRLVGSRRGVLGAIGAVPLHMIHHSCAIAGLGYVFLFEYLPWRLGLRPEPSAQA
jgi:cellulose synthase/poly-beta-1,6-N-acetylglucosamine synthase-like glycosyltransferase